jgi:hypothetical protein
MVLDTQINYKQIFRAEQKKQRNKKFIKEAIKRGQKNQADFKHLCIAK